MTKLTPSYFCLLATWTVLCAKRPANAWLSAEIKGGRRHHRLTDLLAAESEPEPIKAEDTNEKTFFQRVFYRLSPGSDVSNHQGMVLEERVRFRPDPKNPGYIVPMGPRTVLLREGDVEDGEIGEAFLTLQVEPSHRGPGSSFMDIPTIGAALYFAANPALVDHSLMEINAGAGLASFLGCAGAGFVTRGKDDFRPSGGSGDDFLPTRQDSIFPTGLTRLAVTDPSPTNLKVATALARQIGTKSDSSCSTVVEPLDWAHREPKRRQSSPSTRGPLEFFTVLASDLRASYPETKNLAHHVANQLAGLRNYPSASGLPKFVYLARDSDRDLHKLLTEGYRMTVTSSYINVEKLTFKQQELENIQTAADEAALDSDDAILELDDFHEFPLQCMTCTHSPEYAGGGSGELFFPIETGTYDGPSSGSSNPFLERESEGGRPWST